jgi:hypothetical protein
VSTKAAAPADSKFEIGHVLFVDVVGYPKLLIEEQKERLRQLTQIVLVTAIPAFVQCLIMRPMALIRGQNRRK